MSLSSSDIRIIVDALQDSDWDQASVVIGDARISVARNGLPLDGSAYVPAPTAAPLAVPAPAPAAAPVAEAPAPAAAPVPTAQEAADDNLPGATVVTSPSVGVFWLAPQPGAAPFVEVGQHVEKGDTVGIVEVMKLMNNISAEVSGRVVAIHVANAGAVEFGSPLVSILPDN